MSDYLIAGRVVGIQHQQGMGGLRVEAWDKDLILDDLVGAAISSVDGHFRIRFDSAYFQGLFLDRKPDLFFKVFKAQRLIKSTQEAILWNVDRQDVPVTIEVDETVAASPDDNSTAGNGHLEAATTRNILQATYTPRKADDNEKRNAASRSMEKCSFVAHLRPSPIEAKALLKNKSAFVKAIVNEILAMTAEEPETAKIDVIQNAHRFAGIEVEALTDFANGLLELRQKNLSKKDSGAKIRIEHTANLITGFKRSMGAEPVGYLHLEKMSFTPASIERGELVYSVPLSPGEEVNISHREWAHTSEEYEKIVTDYFEEYSEEGVTEKKELAESVNSQNQHTSAFNTSVTASGSYSSPAYKVSITATAGYNASDSSSKSEQVSRNHSADLTRKASSRAKQEHKMSFKVASATETENQTVRKIVNPFADRATRVDYYQLIRKWQVNLYRYGIRLTWDITIPEPGINYLTKLEQIREIRQILEEGFDDNFTLRPEEIGLTGYTQGLQNYTEIASHYDVPVEGDPPDPFIHKAVVDSQDWQSECGGTHVLAYSLDIEIPEGYEVGANAGIAYAYEKCPDGDIHNGWGIKVQDQSVASGKWIYRRGSGTDPITEGNYDGWVGRTGNISVWIRIWKIKFWSMTINLTWKWSAHRFRSWQQHVWRIIRDGVQSAYYEKRQMLKEKLARLEEELGSQDALSLRKKEREEVMKGVLRWLGIENFKFFPPGVGDDLYDDAGLVMEEFFELVEGHGEIIKFLHHAVEWENMLYFLYPYFWSHPNRWEFKKYLDHPDAMHRAFLKAGSARVVLTIRPGFEEAFLAFINTGDMDQLPPSPYMEIGEEFKAFAGTNYPGIPPANPVSNYRPLLLPRQKRCWADMQVIIKFLDAYNQTTGSFPTSEQGLNLLQVHFPDETITLNDPWGNAYVYTSPGVYGDYDLISHGANGLPGGEGEDADIACWAEASLIGQWFEYTPTSALDIAFDEQMPSA